SRAQFPAMPVYSSAVDVVCNPAAITVEQLKEFAVLEPLGCANEPVRYAFLGVTVCQVVPIGAGKHLRVGIEKDGGRISCVYFGVTAGEFPYGKGDVVDLLAVCDINVYQGRESVSIKIKDIRPSSFSQDEFFSSRELCERFWGGETLTSTDINIITPDREDIAAVYRAIGRQAAYRWGVSQLAAATLSNYGKTKNAVKVLKELGLIGINIDNNKYIITVVKGAPKVDLSHSATLQRLKSAT
ncbi:MAG: hypothetical protein ACERKO_13125, partial [Acetanaerobacterium sp.]